MLLAFITSREVLLAEIQRNLGLSASAVSADVDKQLFERLLNATSWNHLEVMEDLRLGDVDKRLSRFLSETKERHGGVYIALHALRPDGVVVASSHPAAIGQALLLPPHWMTVSLHADTVNLHHPQPVSSAADSFIMSSEIPSLFADGTIGTLILEIDWQQIEGALDLSSTPTRQVVVVDEQRFVAAASSELRNKGLHHGDPGESWLPLLANASTEMRDDITVFDGPTVAAYRHSRGFQNFSGVGWTFVLLQSRAEATAPIQRMALIFAGLMGALALTVLLISLWIAGAISRPLIALTHFTRRFLLPGPAPLPPADGIGEVGELTRSFIHMVENLQRSQETLMQASKLAALGEVTALLAHEIRTPLGILRSSAQVLRTETALGQDSLELLQIIVSETERLNRLVSSMLDSSRARTIECIPTDMHSLIMHATALLSSQIRDRGIQLELVQGAHNPTLNCDPEQMTQVLLNLLMNALQILPRGGRIDVTTRDEPQGLVVEIADNGPGIPEDQRSHIFEPFIHGREGGLGLGLAVVRSIVRNHGGEILVEESSMGGAQFSLSLPRT